MASLGEVARTLSEACDKASKCKDALALAEDLVEDARTILGAALAGDTTGDQESVSAQFQEVVDGIRDVWRTLNRGVDRAQSALDSILGVRGPRPVVPVTQPPAANTPRQRSTGFTPSSTLSPDRVEALRRDLPPPVASGTGQKTHGRWVGPDGIPHEIVSGNGPEAESAAGHLRAVPLPRPGLPFATWHAETKLAALMRDTGVRHASVVVNNPPCSGRFGCEVLVGLILPEGSSLTIHGPDGYEKTIPGGLRPPWQR